MCVASSQLHFVLGLNRYDQPWAVSWHAVLSPNCEIAGLLAHVARPTSDQLCTAARNMVGGLGLSSEQMQLFHSTVMYTACKHGPLQACKEGAAAGTPESSGVPTFAGMSLIRRFWKVSVACSRETRSSMVDRPQFASLRGAFATPSSSPLRPGRQDDKISASREAAQDG